MKTVFIAAAAMMGGAALAFALCWVATRLAGGNRVAAARLAKAAEKKMGTMDKVLILEAVVLVIYTAADLAVFWHTGSEPATLTAWCSGCVGWKMASWGGSRPTRTRRRRPPERAGAAEGPIR